MKKPIIKTKTLLLIGGLVAVCVVVFFICRSYSFLGKPSPISPCDKSATTTDCSKIVDSPRPPDIMATISSNPVQSGKIDEHLTINNTLRDLDLCGKIYRVKQVIIDGVDVVQRVAELVSDNQFIYRKNICDIANSLKENGYLISGEIGVPEVKRYTGQGRNSYLISLIDSYSVPENAMHIGDFESEMITGNINIILSGYDTSSIEPVGKIK